MDHIETYWAIANHITAIINIVLGAWMFYKFVIPFMKKRASFIGISYLLALLVIYGIPQEVKYAHLMGILVACIDMCLVLCQYMLFLLLQLCNII